MVFLALNIRVICQLVWEGSIQPLTHLSAFAMTTQAVTPRYTFKYNEERAILADVYVPSDQQSSTIPV
jgi:hypothetical protein